MGLSAWLVATLGCWLVLAGCGSPSRSAGSPAAASPEGRQKSHERMVALLARVGEEARRDNPFLGQNDIERLRAAATQGTEGLPLEQRIALYERLGTSELRLGNTEAAIKAYTSLQELTRPLPNRGKYRGTLFHLGVACMRLGETRNCVARHTSESCLLPIRGNGIHQDQEGSKKAIRCFTELLDETPDLGAQWLLNIAYMTVGGYPQDVPPRLLIPPKTFASDEEFPRFVDIAPRLGVNSLDLAGGAIADDFDGDELLDIVTSSMDVSEHVKFFRNNGDGTFTERSEKAGLSGILGGLNLVAADYDNDSRLDVLVLRGGWMREYGRHPRSLLHNNGDGTFSDVTFDAGLAEVSYPTQTASWADYDGDGDLDLYVGNEADSRGNAYPSQLFRNNGDGTFTDVAAKAGVDNLRYAKGVGWGDYDADRKPDLYVSNIGGENRLYHNNGDGTFTDVAPALGVTHPIDSFAMWFWDFDNDGALDIYVTTYYQASGLGRLRATVASYLGLPSPAEPARLYRGNGRGGFEDVVAKQNLARITFPMGSNFGDLDNDGWLDFYLGTGYPEYEGLIPNVMYRNRGGTGFSDVTTAGGFGHLQKGHGIAFADFDNDGDQDVFEQMGGAQPGDGFGDAFYENPGFGNHALRVKLVGARSNRSAIGARIRAEVVDGGKRRSIYRYVNTGGSFGCNPLSQQIGLGKAARVEVLEIFWPTTGQTQTFRDVAADQGVRIVEGKDALERIPLEAFKLR